MKENKLLKKAAATVRLNLDGFSMTQSGSMTKTKTGYFVSLTNLYIDKLEKLPNLVNFIQYKAAAMHLSHFYYGGWTDSKTGKIYFDLSIRVKSLKKALELAAEYGQAAIYDIAAGDSIYVKAGA
jgi:hypothetical protein